MLGVGHHCWRVQVLFGGLPFVTVLNPATVCTLGEAEILDSEVSELSGSLGGRVMISGFNDR